MFNLSVFALGLIFVLTVQAEDQNLSNENFYRRCMVHLTGRPVPLKDSRLGLIRQGQLSGIQACYELLELGTLGSNGQLSDSKNPLARAVLKTFFSLHRTWFPTNTLEQIQDYTEEVNRGSNDVYDPGEPALTLTRNLLAGLKYKEVLTSEKGVHAIREENEKIKSRYGFNTSVPSRRVFGNSLEMDSNLVVFHSIGMDYNGNGDARPDSDFIIMPKITPGDLIGIRETTESFIIPNLTLTPLGIDRPGNKEPGLNYQYDFFKTYGAGVLGQPVFFMMNYGHGRGLLANGSTKLPRRWMKVGLETFLCSTLPSLRESDVTQYLKPTSPTPFRQGTSCLQCHSTLDQMAYTGRNLVTGATDFAPISSGRFRLARTPIVLTSYKIQSPSVSGWPDSAVKDFHLQQPSGKIYMRTLSGQLINQDVNSLQDIGKIWSEMDDFYTCAAKRYFEYFTGIQVPLYDRTDPKNEDLNKKLSPASILNRSYVENLGHRLKTHQSLKELIKEILASDYYKSKTFQVSP